MLSRVMLAHGPGGMQDHVLALSRELARRGHSVMVITTRHPEGKAYEEMDRVAIHYLVSTKPMKFSRSWRRENVAAFLRLKTAITPLCRSTLRLSGRWLA